MARRSNPIDPAALWRDAIASLTKRFGEGPPWTVGPGVSLRLDEGAKRIVLARNGAEVDSVPPDAVDALVARARAMVPGRGKPAPKPAAKRRDPGPRLPKVFTVSETNQMSAIDNAAGDYYRDEHGMTVWVPKRNVAVMPWFRRTVPLRQDVERAIRDEDAQAMLRAGAHLHIVRWTDPGGGHTETVYVVAPIDAAQPVIDRYDLMRVSGSGIYGGGRRGNPAAPSDDDVIDAIARHVPVGREGEAGWRSPAELVAAARAAGATGPLDYLGAGMIGVVLGDAHGRAYKVARHDNSGDSLEEEADWLDAAARVPFVAAQVSPRRAWRPDLLVLVKDRIDGRDGRWGDESRLWDKTVAIDKAMRAAHWTGPERKANSWIVTPDGRDVLVDAGMAHRMGPVLVAYAEEVLRGERPLAHPPDVARELLIDASAGATPRDKADRLAEALRAMRKANPVYRTSAGGRVALPKWIRDPGARGLAPIDPLDPYNVKARGIAWRAHVADTFAAKGHYEQRSAHGVQTLTRSTRPGVAYQLTYWTPDMTPTGHIDLASIEEAASPLWSELPREEKRAFEQQVTPHVRQRNPRMIPLEAPNEELAYVDVAGKVIERMHRYLSAEAERTGDAPFGTRGELPLPAYRFFVKPLVGPNAGEEEAVFVRVEAAVSPSPHYLAGAWTSRLRLFSGDNLVVFVLNGRYSARALAEATRPRPVTSSQRSRWHLPPVDGVSPIGAPIFDSLFTSLRHEITHMIDPARDFRHERAYDPKSDTLRDYYNSAPEVRAWGREVVDDVLRFLAQRDDVFDATKMPEPERVKRAIAQSPTWATVKDVLTPANAKRVLAAAYRAAQERSRVPRRAARAPLPERADNPVDASDAKLRADADIARRAGVREVGRLRGSCDNVALTLQQRLVKRGIPARVAHGTFQVGGRAHWHVWVDVDGQVIDPTLAQYNNVEKGVSFPRLFVGTYREEPRYRLDYVVADP